jgi:RNA polymerase sigma-70 factor (ECF subfamily)
MNDSGNDQSSVSGESVREEVRRLYEAHGRTLLAYASVFTSDRSTAEDVLHQVFLKLLRGGIEIPAEPLGYLCRAVRNTALNQRRNRARDIDLDSQTGWLESPAGLLDAAIAVESALRTLPEDQREIIVLHVWGGMSFSEAAGVLDVSPNTAASRYRYGLAKLKDRLKSIG